MILTCTVNGQPMRREVSPGLSLLDALREWGFTGAKQGCGVGECGACTVLLDGVPTNGCLTLAVWAQGKAIRTIEGEAAHGELSTVQRAYLEAGAVQCGFCTPGLVMTTTAFVEELQARTQDAPAADAMSGDAPSVPAAACVSREAIRAAHAGHLCRCTGYDTIVTAVELALGKSATHDTREGDVLRPGGKPATHCPHRER